MAQPALISNIDAEQVVLGTLLTDPKAGHFVQLLGIDDFTAPAHRLVFEAVQAASFEGRYASPTMLAPQFRNDRINDEMTIAGYLGKLVAVSTRREVMPDYVRALKDMSGRRALVGLSERMSETGHSASAPLQAFVEDAVGALDEMLSGLRRQNVTSFMLDDLTKAMIERLRSGQKPDLIDTGLRTLNDAIGGFGRGNLIILAGRPSMGKTTVALSAMRQAARRGVSTLFFSQEMPNEPVIARLLSDAVYNSQSPVEYKKIMRVDLQPWEIDRLDDARQSMQGLPIRIDEQTALTVSEIGVRARRYADQLAIEGKRLDVIWIDHLGFLQSSDRYRGHKVYEVGEMTKALRALAKELDCAIVLLCQLSRQIENREEKRPQLSDLRDSGNIEEDADVVLFVFREAYYLGRMAFDDDSEKEIRRLAKLEAMEHIIEIIGSKTRNDAVFSRRCFADMGSNTVRDLAA